VAPASWPEAGRYKLGLLPNTTMLVHGQKDESLANVLRWAEPLGIAVVTIPGADHAFSRRLTVLARVLKIVRSPISSGSHLPRDLL
jgi:alpha/beta superfamily hydrolase